MRSAGLEEWSLLLIVLSVAQLFLLVFPGEQHQICPDCGCTAIIFLVDRAEYRDNAFGD